MKPKRPMTRAISKIAACIFACLFGRRRPPEPNGNKMNASDADKHDLYEVNSERAHLFAYVLIVGLVGELVSGFVWYHGPETLAGMASTLLIVAGVWGEVHFGNKARIEADKQLAEYRAKAADAELQLEKLKQPRLIPWWDFERARPLLEYKGTMFGVFADDDHEALRLARNVVRLLKLVEWRQPPTVGWVDTYDKDGIVLHPNMEGVEIIVHRQESAERMRAAANALSEFFADSGIEAPVKAGEAQAIGITIMVGRRM